MDAETLVAITKDTLTHDILRYVLGAGGVYLVINVALSRRLASRKIRPQTPAWPQIRRELAASARTVLIFAAVGVLISVAAVRGLFPIYTDIRTFGWPYFAASLVLIILAHDTWFYWAHRLMHRPRLYRWFHRLHHRSHNPTPFTSYSFDTSEAVVNAVFLPLFVALVPMHPAALLMFVVHMMLRNALGHCGYEVFPGRRDGRPLFDWLTTVTHHDLHHAHAGYNLGLYFTWWDRWMGTEHPHYQAEFARSAGRRAVPVKTVTGALLAATMVLSTPTHGGTAELDGVYTAPGLGLVLRFEPCAGDHALTCGRLLWGWEIDGFGYARAGDVILRDLERSRLGWDNGHLLDPTNGLSYRGRIQRVDDDQIRLFGCAGPVCRKQVWRRLDTVLGDLSVLK